MLSYYKLLQIFVILNAGYGDFSTKTIGFGYKHNKSIQNINREMQELFRVLNVFSKISAKKATVLFVGSTKEFQKFVFFFSYKTKRTLFLSKWLYGFLTNWDFMLQLSSKIDGVKSNIFSKSKKLRFLKFFLQLKSKRKPSLVLFINYNEHNTRQILTECFVENIPVVVLGNPDNVETSIAPYKLDVNAHNFYTQWFFFQLFVQQIR
jgi:ribosomal protein S2